MLLSSLIAGCFSTAAIPSPGGEALEVSAGHFPHEAFDRVLRAHVDAQGRVDYRALRSDRSELERYLAAVAHVSPDSHPKLFGTNPERLAYWINAYNALTIYAVTERPRLHSVHDERFDFFYFTRYVVGGRKLSLYAIENDIVRERFSEPRIHMALNCASVGCPKLPAEAFVPDRLEEQLGREAVLFCAHPDKFRTEGPSVVLSQIFDWYAEDFVGSGGPVEFCRRWGRTDLPTQVKEVDLVFAPYDWALNAQPGRALSDSRLGPPQ